MKEKKISVLIVDDNVHFAKRMQVLLDELQNVDPISIAGTFKDAAEKLKTQEHDFVLLDINLPDGNGMDLLKQIKNPLQNKKREVIMISNNVDAFYKNKCKKLGAKYFFDKTNDFEKVADLLSGTTGLS